MHFTSCKNIQTIQPIQTVYFPNSPFFYPKFIVFSALKKMPNFAMLHIDGDPFLGKQHEKETQQMYPDKFFRFKISKEAR